MGAQICSQNNQWSSHRQDVTPSSYPQPQTMAQFPSYDEDNLMEQYDNPNRGIIDHNFLKTSFTASNKKMREEKAALGSKKALNNLFQDKSNIISQNQIPSIYRLQSSQLSIGKDEWTEVFRFDSSSIANDFKETEGIRGRKISVYARMKQESIEDEDSQHAGSILRQVSDYMLSQKNVFQPIAINKEQFVRFRKDQIEKHYSFVEKIGEGTFGNVFKVYHRATKQFRAIKILKKSAVSKTETNKIMKQIQILKKLDHPHIVKIYEVFIYQNNYYIVTEHCEGGSLSKYFKGNSQVSIEIIKSIFKQLISALSYIHQLGIIHRDIKLDNIILTKRVNTKNDIDIRIIDFGLSKELKVKRLKDKQMVGTHTYMAPEVIQGVYSTKCDIWSAGIVLLYMIAGKNPFKGKSKEQTLEKIKKDKILFTGQRLSGISLDVKTVLLGVLDKNPRSRMSSEQVLACKWLTQGQDDEDASELLSLVARKFYDYYRSNNFVSVIESYIAYTTTPEKLFKIFSRCFKLLDKNKDGFIEINQIRKAFEASKNNFSAQQIEYVLRKIQKEQKGKINFTQFVTKLSNRSKLFTQPALLQAFEYLDQNNNGYLERGQLKKALKNLDCSQLSYIIEQLDQNQDDRISLAEFVSYLNKDEYNN